MKSKNIKYQDENYVIRQSRNWVTTQSGSLGEYLSGKIFTPYGIVSVLSGNSSPDSQFTRLDFIIKNRQYIRRYRKRFTKRGLTTLATRFAREIVSKKKPK